MDVKHEKCDWESVEPDTLIRSLKCPVCWDYFVRPHTLVCGHTFCMKCLQKLARVTRSAQNRTPLNNLRIRCPSCRRMILARPIVRGKAAVNYAIWDFVDEWFESPYSSGIIDYIGLRSAGSQTEPDNTNIIADLKETTLNTRAVHPAVDAAVADTPEEDCSTIAQTEYRTELFHRIDWPKSNKLAKREITVTDSSPSYDTVTQSSSEGEESEEDLLIAPLFDNLNFINGANDINRPRVGRFRSASVSVVLTKLVHECLILYRMIRQSRSRTVLTFVWFIYSGLIICSCPSRLPLMTFYTVIFFMAVYAEMATPPLFR